MAEAVAWGVLSTNQKKIRWSGDRSFVRCCPAHRDQEPSLSVRLAEDGCVLAKCFAGCSFAAIAAGAGLRERDFFPAGAKPLPPQETRRPGKVVAIGTAPKRVEQKRPSGGGAGAKPLLSLVELAKRKNFEVGWLNEIGVWDYPIRGSVPETPNGVLIAYADEDGKLAQRQRRRTALRAKDGCGWTGPRGVSLIPYGLWTLDIARARRFLIIVEGETDCWALWLHGWPALGLPGATNENCLKTEHLRELDKVYIVQESDEAGAAFPARAAARLRNIGYKGEMFALAMPAGAKDPCDLHIAGTFDQEFQWSFENAAPIGSAVQAVLRVDCNIAGSDLELRTQATFASLSEINSGASPELYSNSAEPVLLRDGRAAPANLPRMRQWLTSHLNFQSYDRRGNLAPVTPPDVLVQNVMVYQPSPLPHLRRVVRRPAFAADGRLIDTPGYDVSSGLVYVPSAQLAHVKAGEDVAAALELISDLVCDFNFETPADRAHWYAFLFQPLFRELIDGPTPIYRFEAPKAGTGKGLLFNLGAAIYGGHVFTTPHGNEEEWGKSLLTHLRTNPELLLIDNCSNLDSDHLAAATTAWPMWTARLLGTLDSFSVPVRTLWAVTINNPQLKEDVYRRTVRIRIVPGAGVENPSTRTDFRHRPLLGYLHSRLPEFLEAVLTLGVYAKKRMQMFRTRTLGSYEEWAAVMGGVLEALEIKGFLQPIDGADLARDRTDLAWTEFVALWHERFGSSWVRSAGLVGIAQQTDLDLGNGNDRAQQINLGRLLARRRGGVFDGLLVDSQTHDHALQYRVINNATK